ncbi:MAG: N-acetyltransferase [Gammaproteobacteria bacterium]|nr:N-acetyltransferase [Gammaproteobacteria bacterium]MDH5594397.1 N-acetyltransferase [Gammaproteobacteria bacterium]MDH5614064.1 N-acetyltransferase [Gammaproteobacteria bacterium]
MTDIQVRSETNDDIRAIDVVNLSAFQGEAEARFVTNMRKSADFKPETSLVAEFNGRIVGHVLLTRVTMRKDSGDVSILLLGPMSVVPSQSHRGIGTELIKAALDKAKALHFGAVIVIGHPDYYKRAGFEAASKWNLRYSINVLDDAVTGMELIKGTLEGGGEVILPPDFASVIYG